MFNRMLSIMLALATITGVFVWPHRKTVTPTLTCKRQQFPAHRPSSPRRSVRLARASSRVLKQRCMSVFPKKQTSMMEAPKKKLCETVHQRVRIPLREFRAALATATEDGTVRQSACSAALIKRLALIKRAHNAFVQKTGANRTSTAYSLRPPPGHKSGIIKPIDFPYRRHGGV